jgi:hypothetical protein
MNLENICPDPGYEGITCFDMALSYRRSVNDLWNLANTLGDLANLHLNRGNWLEAEKCLAEAWAIVEAQPESHFIPLRNELANLKQQLHGLSGFR